MIRSILTTTFILFAFVLSAQTLSVPQIGVCAPLSRAELISANGYSFIQPTVAEVLQPFVADSLFDPSKATASAVEVSVINVFIPGSIKTTGPDVDETRILDYAETVFRRAKHLNIGTIVFGSGASRRIPEGWNRDTAFRQFVDISKKLAVLASRYDVTLALESQNKLECNFLNTLKECIDVANAVDHPNFKITVDIYHMLREEEPASVILTGARHIHHCDIGEKETRSAPGIAGDDFVPFFKAFQEIGYQGKIGLECRFTDIEAELPIAYKTIHEQWETALQKN